jgi:hypothetical protein
MRNKFEPTYNRDIKFLKDCFPNVDEFELRDALEENINDIGAAIDCVVKNHAFDDFQTVCIIMLMLFEMCLFSQQEKKKSKLKKLNLKYLFHNHI